MKDGGIINIVDEKVSTKTALSILAVALVSFSGIMSETSMNVTFPVLSKLFNTSLNTIQWVTTAYLLSVTVMVTTSAYLTKRFSVRTLWLTGVIIFTAGTLVGGLANNVPVLLLGRIMQGVAAGIAMPLMFNIIIANIPQSRIGTWMGIGSLVVSLAPSFGPTYGGALIDSFGWRSIFFILLIVPIISLLVGWRSVAHTTPAKLTQKFDSTAFILLAITLTAALLTVNQLQSGQINWSLFSVTVVALMAFIWRALTSKQLFLNIRLLLRPRYASLLLVVGLYMFANLGFNLIGPNFLQDIQHTSSFAAGFSLLPGTLLGAVLNPWFGRIYDLKGAKLPLYLGNFIFLLSVVVMALIAQSMTLWVLIVAYIVFTFGRNMAFGNGMTAAVADVEVDMKADANAIMQTFQMFMGALGTTVAALYGAGNAGMVAGFANFLWVIVGVALVNVVLLVIHFKSKVV